MVTLILLIIDTNILFILPFISSYFITLELYIRLSNTQILILGTMALFTIMITVIITITINNNNNNNNNTASFGWQSCY